jgi:ribose transport system ATP-binding protein
LSAADPDAGASPALVVTNVSKTFPSQRALDGVSLTVRPGEVHALLGENGSGKSTLIKVLAGVHLPDPGGDVQVNGRRLPLGSPSASFDLGLRFVHQKLGVIPEMNAVENVGLEAGFARGAFIDWNAQADLTRRLLGHLNVNMDIWKPLRDCKPVERSAVAIARALRTNDLERGITADDVPLVVLDEPTSSLPAAEVQQLFSVIRDLTSKQVAVIYVSHRLDEVFQIADRVSVLRDGRLRGTAEMADMTRSQLIQLIVGREIAQSWQRPVRKRRELGGRPALEVTGLVSERIAGVSFNVARGEVLGVVGVAGSGRELMARTLAGDLLPESGQLVVDGDRLPVVTPPETIRRGLMLALGNTQPHSAIASFTVQENVTLGALKRYAAPGRLFRRRERREAKRWMESLDLRPRDPQRLYRLLSGGNQQKVILAKWLSADPKVLVLDEPTAGVDVGARQSIYQLISEQAEAGLAVVLCSSDLEDVVSLCDRAVVLRGGTIVAELIGDELEEHRLLLESVGDDISANQPIHS